GGGRILREAYATLNLHYVGPLFYPGVYIITKSPLNSLADLKGMKLRAPGGYGKFVAKLGALPVTMAFGETYAALSTGVIDGCCSSTLVDYRDGRFYESAKYICPQPVTVSQVCPTLVNLDAWNGLAEDLKAIVEIASSWHATEQLTSGVAWTSEAVSEMQTGGMEWGPALSSADAEVWRTA